MEIGATAVLVRWATQDINCHSSKAAGVALLVLMSLSSTAFEASKIAYLRVYGLSI